MQKIMEGGRKFKLFDSKKKRSAGEIEFINCNFIPNFLLVDYLRGGLKITADFFMNFSTANSLFDGKSNIHLLPPGSNPYTTCFNQVYGNLHQYTLN
jgi:hypothetical protein